MSAENTKEKILDAALALFSEKGYDGVGVDLLAARIGIRGPSLYRYFAGKEDILNAVLNRIEAELPDEPSPAVPADCDALIRMTAKEAGDALREPQLIIVRRLLVKEQFRSPRLAALAEKCLSGAMLERYIRVFDGMVSAGTLKNVSPALLATEYVSPVVLLTASADRGTLTADEAEAYIRAHLAQFVRTYGRQTVGTDGRI